MSSLLSEAHYKRLFMHSPALYAIISVDGYFKEVNASWAGELGFSAEELCASPVVDFICPEDIGHTQREMSKLKNTPTTTVELQNRFKHKTGSIVWLSWYVFLDQEHGLFYCTAKNITQQKNQDTAEKYQLKTQLENAFLCLRQLYQVTSDPYQRINDKLEKVLSVACQYLDMEYGVINHIEGDKQYSLYASDESVRLSSSSVYDVNETVCQFTFNQSEVLEIPDLKDSMLLIPVSILDMGLQSYIGCTLNVEGKKFGTVCFVSSNIHKRFTEHQKEILRLFTQWISSELENERNKDQLQTALKQSQKASDAKTKFISSVSHELRTPLNSIIGFTNRLVKNLADKIEARHLDALQTVERNGQHLLSLINDILDISRLESGKIQTSKEYIQLDEFIVPIIKQLNPLSELKGLAIIVDAIDAELRLFADRKMLTQIVINLLSNAIKYTKVGYVRLTIAYDEQNEENTAISIAVKDTGMGISEEDKAQLFTTFFRSDNHLAHNISGTGLGLSIIKEFVALHQGDVKVESTLGEGSTFTVIFPKLPVYMKSSLS